MLGIGHPAGTTNGAQRQVSTPYALFDKDQIQVFKDAFGVMDQNNDGLVDASDLMTLLTSLGQNPTSQQVQEMLAMQPSASSKTDSINFASFLTMMAQHLSDFSPTQDLLEAFASFDDDDSGYVAESDLRKWLAETGDGMSASEIDRFIAPPYLDKRGRFDYRAFCRSLQVTDDD